MAGMTISGDKRVARRFREIANNADTIEKAWPEVGRYLSSAVSRQFSTSGAYLGTPWRPLKPEYRLRKLRSGFGRRILVQSGEMRGTFTGRPMQIEIYSGNSAIFGSANQKAIWHQHGTHRDGKRVNPPRPMLRVTAFVRRDVKDIMKKHVLGG